VKKLKKLTIVVQTSRSAAIAPPIVRAACATIAAPMSTAAAARTAVQI
jgi:hypothetical protein